jgi:hypothetical protein
MPVDARGDNAYTVTSNDGDQTVTGHDFNVNDHGFLVVVDTNNRAVATFKEWNGIVLHTEDDDEA